MTNIQNTPCPGTCPLEAALTSILNSIANEENALACILSAECAKINTIVSNYNDFEALVAIDDSVQLTLERVTALENVLLTKMNSVLTALGDES